MAGRIAVVFNLIGIKLEYTVEVRGRRVSLASDANSDVLPVQLGVKQVTGLRQLKQTFCFARLAFSLSEPSNVLHESRSIEASGTPTLSGTSTNIGIVGAAWGP